MVCESVVNMKIAAENVRGIADIASNWSYGGRIDTEQLMQEIILSVEELVQKSKGLKVEDATQTEVNGKIVADLTIATEKLKDMAVDSKKVSGSTRNAAEHLVIDILLSIDELVHDSAGLKIENIVQKKVRGKIAVGVQIVAEEVEVEEEPADNFLDEDFMTLEMMERDGDCLY